MTFNSSIMIDWKKFSRSVLYLLGFSVLLSLANGQGKKNSSILFLGKTKLKSKFIF